MNYNSAVQTAQFSSPQVEELFKHVVEVSEGKNIMIKKHLVELIGNAKHRIDTEIAERTTEIANHHDIISELKSAKDGLTIESDIKRQGND